MNDCKVLKVLLIEDNAADAELTMRALRKHNMANELVWVKDGAEALDFLFDADGKAKVNHAPKVILLDLRLPKVDGLEVLHRLKADPVAKSIPVVVLTSSTQDQDIIESYQLGVNSFVSKPVKFEDFAEVVAQLGLYWLLINKKPEA
jgi:CheY-like chemotaxis protein